jgi:NTE family protein
MAMPEQKPLPRRPADYDKKVSLLLQGGGALGSYQAGVYEALAEADYLPDWVAGISIGAINAAIIAGNPPETRVAQLRRFWEEITAPTSWWPTGLDPFVEAQRKAGAFGAILFGQPGFYTPRGLLDFLPGQNPTSYYSTQSLRGTLERLVDFDRINARTLRFSVGAVNVRTGRFMYFDNTAMTIRAEHIMASGALPPGFPAVEIDGELYWDGGLISNTPLTHVLETEPRISQLCFQVDLFQAYGKLPETLDEVAEREKDIRFASRTRSATETLTRFHNLRSRIDDLLKHLPPELRRLPEARALEEIACETEMDIVHLIYRPFAPQGSTKDFEFSRVTMQERWRQGREDAWRNLVEAPWLAPHPPEIGTRVFDVLHDMYVREAGLVTGN